MTKNTITLICCIALAGCSTYSETFDCPPIRGVGCKALSTVDQMVERGELPHLRQEEYDEDKRPLPLVSISGDSAAKGLKVWIAPYRDGHGHYHEEAFVHLNDSSAESSP